MRAIASRVKRLETSFGLEPDSEETLRLRARLEAAQQRLSSGIRQVRSVSGAYAVFLAGSR